jgi:hypothetical protein
MKRIMKAAVNAMYRLLCQRDHNPEALPEVSQAR